MIEAVLPSTSSVYYIREPGGALIARVAGAATSYYHFDALGSTRLLTDASGSVTDTYSYDAWGNTTHDTGELMQPYQYVGQLGYYTHYQDTNLGLLQLGVRFYDPGMGRFTQVDPVQTDGVTAYNYGESKPTSLVDPDGLLAGRYKKCAKVCAQKGARAAAKCLACKKGVDQVCKRGGRTCLEADKVACYEKCAERKKKHSDDDDVDCLCECEQEYIDHWDDGGAFE